MRGIDYVFLGIAVAGVLYGTACLWHLARWVSRARRSRWVIGYKRKAVMQGSLEELMEYAHMVEEDKLTTGHTMYRGGHVSFSITRSRAGEKRAEVVKQT